MKKIALAVGREYKEITVEDKLLANCLRGKGFDAQTLVWDEPNPAENDFDAVVVHSCWGYHKQPQKFLNWIAEIEKRNIQIFNPPPVLRLNLDKSYLRELAAKSVELPPTVWFQKNESGDLTKILRERGWRKAVLKPTVSATAWRTFLVAPENAARLQPEFEHLLRTGGALVQEFVGEIETRGEWSFVFFDKKFSHAVLKRAKAGDFRVQNNFGGTIEFDAEPPRGFVETARKIVSAVPEDLLYARVDVVEAKNGFCLMELELIEPQLFLENNSSALQKFADAIGGRLETNRIKQSL